MNKELIKKKVQVVVIAEGSLLLLEFNNQVLNNYVGFQNITGGVEGVETYVEAALRELVEEIGVTAPVIDLKTEFKFFDRWKKDCVERVFLCHLEKQPIIALSEEHLFFKWIPVSDVQKIDYTFPTNYDAFLVAKKFLESRNNQ